MEGHAQAMLLAQQRCLRGDALADLHRKFAQAVVQGADVAQADDDAARFHRLWTTVLQAV